MKLKKSLVSGLWSLVSGFGVFIGVSHEHGRVCSGRNDPKITE